MSDKKKKLKRTKPLGTMFCLIFVGMMLLTCTYSIFYDISTYDLLKDDLTANLRAEQTKCQTAHMMMTNNERDFINNERTNSDNNAFKIDNKCYKLMNDFIGYQNLQITKFKYNYIGNYVGKVIGSLIVSFVITLIYFITFVNKVCRKEEDEDENNWY